MQNPGSVCLSFNFGQYPFGMLMVGRNWESGSADGYRFGFNGYENTDEILGDNIAIDYGARIYDSRLGKFFSIDPRSTEYPWQSVYAYYSNSPIWKVDIDGMGGPNQYTIKEGDTYWDLAQNSGGAYTVEDLIAWNPGVDYNNLQIDQAINIEDPSCEALIGGDDAGFIKINRDMEDYINFGKDYFYLAGNNFDYTIENPLSLGGPIPFMSIKSRYEDFRNGTGPTNMVYGPNSEFAYSLSFSKGVNNARSYFYGKYQYMFLNSEFNGDDVFNNNLTTGKLSVTNYGFEFSPLNIFTSGIDMGEQFTGSYSLNIFTSADAMYLIFVVANSTSKYSYRYHGYLGIYDENEFNIPRSSAFGGNPESTILNLIIWSEPINFERFSTGK